MRGQAIGAESWFVPILRDGWHHLPGFSSFPLPHPGVVLDVPSRLTLKIALVPGPGFSSHLFLVEKASGSWSRDHSLSPERVHPSYSFHNGNRNFCTVICQRRAFSSFPESEGCLPSDPNSSFLEEAMGFTSEWTVTSSTPYVSDSQPLLRLALRSSSV